MLKPVNMKYVSLLLFAGLGIIDASYLTYEHFFPRFIPCSVGTFVDCGKVLTSQYSIIFGVPLALVGIVHYSVIFALILFSLFDRNKVWIYLLFMQTSIGLIASIYFMYLQLGVIGAICLYCTISALNSLVLFFICRYFFGDDYKQRWITILAGFYKKILKPFFFLFDAELVHNGMVTIGEILGSSYLTKKIMKLIFAKKYSRLHQKLCDIVFYSPIGLSAGFDYEAKLTQITPALGFGFQSVGTITNHSYEGNPTPRLGRLPKSKSLMVNKGFKNQGAKTIAQKLQNYGFEIPIGISIGRTNSKNIDTVKKAIEDIVKAFKTFEKSKVRHAYYELNISCPNLYGSVSFYSKQNLQKLLTAIDNLSLSLPVFVKMPIEKTDLEVLDMLSIIVKHTIAGIIIGNLQKNRKDPALYKHEVAQFSKGNFSGKPTEQRANELISLAYKNYGKELLIIGCGGVFNAHDAYTKLKLGASLIQLITGMVYNGPQLIAQINHDLNTMLKDDGYSSIHEVIGSSC